jgi:hypothetical protein
LAVTINEPFADAGYTAQTYSLSGGLFGGSVVVNLTASSATLTCPATTAPPIGFNGPFTGFDTDGVYNVFSSDDIVHPIECMQIAPNGGGVTTGASGILVNAGPLNFGATTGITFCCGALDGAGNLVFQTNDFN